MFIFPILITAVQVICAILVGSFVYDIMHYMCHQSPKNSFLKRIASYHLVHHSFYGRALKYVDSKMEANRNQHIILECVAFLLGASLFSIFTLNWISWLIACGLIIAKCGYEYIHEGKDYQHRELETVPAVKGLASSIFVGGNYHALHHIYPEAYFSSVLGLFDFVFGKLAYFKTKKIHFDIQDSHFTETLQETVLGAGAKLSETNIADILVISKNKDTKAKIDAFYEANKSTAKKKIAPEVWVIGHDVDYKKLDTPADLYVREIILDEHQLKSSMTISKVWPKIIRNYQVI